MRGATNKQERELGINSDTSRRGVGITSEAAASRATDASCCPLVHKQRGEEEGGQTLAKIFTSNLTAEQEKRQLNRQKASDPDQICPFVHKQRGGGRTDEQI